MIAVMEFIAGGVMLAAMLIGVLWWLEPPGRQQRQQRG